MKAFEIFDVRNSDEEEVYAYDLRCQVLSRGGFMTLISYIGIANKILN